MVESRWLFGPEFDSPEFVSNVSLNSALRDLFGKKPFGGEIENPRKRADILALPDRSISGTATEHIDEASGFPVITQVLLIELKRGAAEINRENVHQATDYVEDLLKSGLIDGAPMFRVYVIGHSVSNKIELTRKVGDRAAVHVITYGQLVRLANMRLFRLKERLSERYIDVSAAALLDRILTEPEQLILDGTVK